MICHYLILFERQDVILMTLDRMTTLLPKKTIHLLLLITMTCLAPLAMTSCSDNYDKIPHTGFIRNYQHDKDNRTPFLSYWAKGNEKEWNDRVAGVKGKKQVLYVKDINVSYMEKAPQNEKQQKDLDNLRTYFKNSLVTHLTKAESKGLNFKIQNKPTCDAYILEIAITSITPTNIKGNLLSLGVGTIQRGADILSDKIIPKGHISIAGKLWDNKGKLIAEIADYEEDHGSLLGLDVKNFSRYAHHRKNIDNWCDEFTTALSSPTNTKIKKQKIFLNPF